jgi:hypothetical protein
LEEAYNGSSDRIAEALAIKDGEIVAVGSNVDKWRVKGRWNQGGSPTQPFWTNHS